MPSATPTEPKRWFVVASWLGMGLLLWLVLRFDLLPTVLAGLLVFEVVHLISMRLRFLRERRARLIAVAFVAALVVGLLSLAAFAVLFFFRSESGGYVALLRKADEVIQIWRGLLPPWVLQSLPADAAGLQRLSTAWVREHLAEVRQYGREGATTLARVVIGMVIGALVALRQAQPPAGFGPFAGAMVERVVRFGQAFRRIIFAQLRIAALNTALTAIYLAAVLPLLGFHLPLIKTMIVITFIVGLIPVFGNLISNVVVVMVSLSVSPYVAVGSLVYLVVIHKLEYFLNASLVGRQIKAAAWEMLLAMLLLESIFGIAGLIAAPIYYAYLKDELSNRGWV